MQCFDCNETDPVTRTGTQQEWVFAGVLKVMIEYLGGLLAPMFIRLIGGRENKGALVMSSGEQASLRVNIEYQTTRSGKIPGGKTIVER